MSSVVVFKVSYHIMKNAGETSRKCGRNVLNIFGRIVWTGETSVNRADNVKPNLSSSTRETHSETCNISLIIYETT